MCSTLQVLNREQRVRHICKCPRKPLPIGGSCHSAGPRQTPWLFRAGGRRTEPGRGFSFLVFTPTVFSFLTLIVHNSGSYTNIYLHMTTEESCYRFHLYYLTKSENERDNWWVLMCFIKPRICSIGYGIVRWEEVAGPCWDIPPPEVSAIEQV